MFVFFVAFVFGVVYLLKLYLFYALIVCASRVPPTLLIVQGGGFVASFWDVEVIDCCFGVGRGEGVRERRQGSNVHSKDKTRSAQLFGDCKSLAEIYRTF